MKKGFVAGVLATMLILSIGGTVFARAGTVTQELIYNNIGVTLDGKRLDLRDAQGSAVEPFMFNGTNYLPVRAICEALGLNVDWNGSTNTIVLTAQRPQSSGAVGSGTLGDYYVEIKDAVLAEDHEGKPAIIITYAWTNNSEKTTNVISSIYEQAFQDGVQLDPAIFGIFSDTNYDAGASIKKVRPGTTIDIQCAFALTSESVVEFELRNFPHLNLPNYRSEMVSMNFDPKALR